MSPHHPELRSRFGVARRIAPAAIVILFALVSTLGVHGAPHRAKLSVDLLNFEGRRAAGQARVIVHGTRADVDALAARHHVAVARYLDDSAVVLVNSRELTDLAADTANDTLSGDVPVAPFMTVSNASTA